MKQQTRKLSGFLVMLLYCAIQLYAHDTIRLTLPEAEKQFLEKNLALLAEKYNIDIARAQVIQAKLYTNPQVGLTGSIYNPQGIKVFDVSDKTGEYIVEVQQLIRLAGKRNKEIKLAETHTRISENRFFDLLRTLRFSLRSNFYEAFYLQNSITAYETHITSLEKLSAAYEGLKLKGVVTIKDAVRIRSLLYNLKTEQTSLQNRLYDLQADLQILLQNNKAYFIPVADTNPVFETSVKNFDLSSLIDTAYNNRFDLKGAENNVLYHQQNLLLQKALSKPDITLGVQFDKRGSFVDNASFFTAAVDLPFFHRNQGNIKAAQISIEQSKIYLNMQKLSIENEVQTAYTKVLNTQKLLQSIDPNFKEEFGKLLQGITDNFQKKNISLIEFTDFYESYKNNILQINQLQNDKMQAIEALHFAIGKTIINK